MRAKEFIIEDDHIVYHGGTYSGDTDYDPDIIGEPGDLRPMGIGLYAAATPGHAERYVKYSENSKVHKFKVSPNAKLYPWGGAAWRELSTDQQDYWRELSDNIQQEFIKHNLVKKEFGKNDKYYHWTTTIGMGGHQHNGEKIRQLLVSLGIDGARSILPSELIEYVFYNPKVLIPIKDKK